MVLKLGSKGKEVELLQQYLKITVDGDFGPNTEKAVKQFQKDRGLNEDGIVGSKTWSILGLASTDQEEKASDPDFDLDIKPYYLPAGESVAGNTKKHWIFLHHTAGWHNPYQVVDAWELGASEGLPLTREKKNNLIKHLQQPKMPVGFLEKGSYNGTWVGEYIY